VARIKLKLVKVEERGEGLYGDGSVAEVRKGCTLHYEGFDGAIKLTINFTYKKDKELQDFKAKNVWIEVTP